MIKKLCILLLTSTLIILSACDSSINEGAKQQKITAIDLQNVAWMRDKLPANTLAYVRIPNIWQMFFEAKAGVLHHVQKQQEHSKLINDIKVGVIDTYSDFIPQNVQLPIDSLLNDMISPLEIAILNDSNGSMAPHVMIATTFKNTSVNDINAFFNGLIENIGPQLQLTSPFDAQGHGKLLAAMMPIYADFNEKTGQLLLLAGLNVNRSEVDAILAQKQHDSALENIISYEKSIDQAGKNLEFWLNIKSIYQHNKSFIPPSMAPLLTQFGLDKIEYVWAGTATKNGKSEMILRVAMPEVGIRQLMPRVDSSVEILTAGMPQSVWQIAIPTVEQIQQGFDWALSFDKNPEHTRKIVMQQIDKINEFLGMTLTEIFQAYGQKLTIVNDAAGTWMASLIKDRSVHDQFMQKLANAFDAQNESKSLAGVEINQFLYDTKAIDKLILPEGKDMMGLNTLLFTRQSAYYQIDGDYYIQAFTPQVLADRANSTNKMKLSQWLTDQQSLNFDQAIFAYSKEVLYAPRDIYHFYLGVLKFLGYLTNVEVDLFDFPTAQQLNLPKKGRYGFALESSTEAIAMKFSYEYSILENMSLIDGYLTMAAVGIVAAYAVPAYNDYTVRTKLNQKLLMINLEKNAIAEHYAENGSFPSQEDLLLSIVSQTGGESENIDYDYDEQSGAITLYFTDDGAELNGKNIVFTPNIESNGHVNWSCDGTVDRKYFKYRCE